MSPELSLQTVIALLLAINGFFLRRLVTQFDRFNETQQRHDRELAVICERHKAEDQMPALSQRRRRTDS